jgi:hypothetical protein
MNTQTTVLVEYIGEKDFKADNVAGSGMAWHGKGDVRPVAMSAWAVLSRHPGVWRLAELPAGEPSKTLSLADAPKAPEGEGKGDAPPPPASAPAPRPPGRPSNAAKAAAKAAAQAEAPKADADKPADAPAGDKAPEGEGKGD